MYLYGHVYSCSSSSSFNYSYVQVNNYWTSFEMKTHSMAYLFLSNQCDVSFPNQVWWWWSIR